MRLPLDRRPRLAHFPRVTSPAPAVAPRLPREFGRYLLFDEIGRGGMAQIFLARAEAGAGASRHVVVKEILPEYAERAEFADMLVREAKLAAKLSHKNVVQVHDLGRERGTLFIAMEYVEGFDLSALLKRCSKERVPLPPEFALFIAMEMLSGLDYAHRAKGESGAALGLVHRDVSPSNVLVSFEGEVKLCDFGISRANDAMEGEPDEAVKGKAGYMSPEHARGESLDARADVFSAGIVLWEMFAGRKLYVSKLGDLLEQAKRAEIPDLPDRDLPDYEELRRIVRRALSPDLDARYPSAAAMLRDLEAYVQKSKLTASALKLGGWLEGHFGQEMQTRRRARERAAQAIQKGPAVSLKAIRTPEAPVVTHKAEGHDDEVAPSSLVGTSIDLGAVPEAASSSPALVRDSEAPKGEEKKPTAWIWVLVAIVLLGALWSAMRH